MYSGVLSAMQWIV